VVSNVFETWDSHVYTYVLHLIVYNFIFIFFIQMHIKVHDGVLRIQQVRQEDRGVYICEAENSAGSDYDTVTIELESMFCHASGNHVEFE